MDTKWKVMPCPVNGGRHPYHDSRYIVTDDAVVEWNGDGTEWTLDPGSCICIMRDVDPAYAHLIAAAPEMARALRGARDALVEAGRSFAASNPLASRPNLFELHARAVCEVLARVAPRVVPIPECAPAVKCDNCNWTGTADQTRPARDLWKRMDACGPVPAGECPECGCFAYTTCTARMEVKR